MPLHITVGQHSAAGRKPVNQDFHGLCLPREPQLSTKGIAIATADGISSSDVSHVAAQAAVHSFLEDYYCTSEAWSVRTSAERVLAATNAWLYSQTQQGQGRFDKDRGHVCTFSALVLKSATAHVFHVGDTRIYQVQGKALEQLTQDHRVQVSSSQSYLSRALGIAGRVEIEYRSLSTHVGDTFVLATDGVYEHVPQDFIVATLARHADDLDQAARVVVAEALARGSPDNCTVQLVRIDALPAPEAGELTRQLVQLPWPPLLEPRSLFDGYRIVRTLHASSRSHVYLAVDEACGAPVVLKTPSVALQGDAAHLERFLLEEWVARRIDSPHVLKPCPPARRRNFAYVAMEYVEGHSLAQWMRDHPRPGLDAVRSLVGQLAKGLRAFHRGEMLHGDLRPQNVLIDATGTARIIDFGSATVASLQEIGDAGGAALPPGDLAYAAPEHFTGEGASTRSDQFSLAVMAYQLLGGGLPYGTRVAQCRTPADARRLRYEPLRETRPDVPDWIDEALRKALYPDPERRYADVSEFVFHLHQPEPVFLARRRIPLLQRRPLLFWKSLSLGLGVLVLALLGVIIRGP